MNKYEKQLINKIYSDYKPHRRGEMINDVMYKLNDFTEEELEEKTANGNRKIYSEIDWAISHLKEKGYTLNPSRGIHIISDKGKEYLNQTKQTTLNKNLSPNTTSETTTKETLLKNLKYCSNSKFEEIIVDLISKMGYGKFKKITQKSRDGGIDGIISEDPLELYNTYVQAKKWNKTKIGVKEIREFKGALNDKNANNGVLISTSTFTNDAINSAKKSNIKLINGQELSELLIKYQIGIKTRINYVVDGNYFS